MSRGPAVTGRLRTLVTLIVILAFVALAILALNTRVTTHILSMGSAAEPLNPGTTDTPTPTPTPTPAPSVPVIAEPPAIPPASTPLPTATSSAPTSRPTSTSTSRPTPRPSPTSPPPAVGEAAVCPIPVPAAGDSNGGLQSLVGFTPAFGPFSAEAFAMAPAYAPMMSLLGPLLAQYPKLAEQAAPLVGPLINGFAAFTNAGYGLLAPLYGPYRHRMLVSETKLAQAIAPFAIKLAKSPMGACLVDLEGALIALTVPANTDS